MTRVHLHILLALSLVLAPLHHVLAMPSSAGPACAEMGHHGHGTGDGTHSAHHADMGNHDNGSQAHSDGLCNGCASCTHCAFALTTFISVPTPTGVIQSGELRVTLRSVDTHPDLRPPRFS